MLKNPSYLTHYINAGLTILLISSWLFWRLQVVKQGTKAERRWPQITRCHRASTMPLKQEKTSGKHGQLGHVFVKFCQFSLEETIDFGWWDEIPNYKIDRHIAKKRVGSAVVLNRCALEEETSIFSKCSNKFNTYGPSRKLFSNQLEQTNRSTCKRLQTECA